MSQTALFHEINIDKLSYGTPKRNKRGSYNVYVNPDTQNRFEFQLGDDEERLKMPFGVREPFDASADPNRKTLDVSVSSPKLAEWLGKLDARNIDEAHKNAKAWFHKDLARETIETLYKPVLSESTKEGYDPTFKCKVTPRTKVYVVRVDEDGEESYEVGTEDDLQPGTHGVLIVSSPGMWFMAKQFGESFTADQILVYPRQEQPEFAFNLTRRPKKMATGSKKREREEEEEEGMTFEGHADEGEDCAFRGLDD